MPQAVQQNPAKSHNKVVYFSAAILGLIVFFVGIQKGMYYFLPELGKEDMLLAMKNCYQGEQLAAMEKQLPKMYRSKDNGKLITEDIYQPEAQMFGQCLAITVLYEELMTPQECKKIGGTPRSMNEAVMVDSAEKNGLKIGCQPIVHHEKESPVMDPLFIR